MRRKGVERRGIRGKDNEGVNHFENEGEDGGMKRKSDEATYACPQEVRVVPQQMCCGT